jgi:hypothetical protein
MAQATPQLEPPGAMRTASAAATAPATPIGRPPAGLPTANGESRDARAATVTMERAAFDVAPSLRPMEDGVGVAAWNTGKKVTALWSINQNRNSWIHIDGVGWRKLANNSDSAIVALTVLGTHAREKASSVNYRDEADGMIHEIYVW